MRPRDFSKLSHEECISLLERLQASMHIRMDEEMNSATYSRTPSLQARHQGYCSAAGYALDIMHEREPGSTYFDMEKKLKFRQKVLAGAGGIDDDSLFV